MQVMLQLKAGGARIDSTSFDEFWDVVDGQLKSMGLLCTVVDMEGQIICHLCQPMMTSPHPQVFLSSILSALMPPMIYLMVHT